MAFRKHRRFQPLRHCSTHGCGYISTILLNTPVPGLYADCWALVCLYARKWGNQPFRGLCCQIYSCPRENNQMVVIDVFGMPVTGILFIKMVGLFLFNLVDAIKDHKRTSWWDSGASGSAPCSLRRQWLNLDIKCQMLLDNTYHWQITSILRRISFVQRAQNPSCSPSEAEKSLTCDGGTARPV